MPLTCGETLSNLTFMYAVCWLDCADMPLDCGATPSSLGDESFMGSSVILFHAMGGLPSGSSTYLCLGGMLAPVNLEHARQLVWSGWLVMAFFSHELQTGFIQYLLDTPTKYF